MRNFFFLSLIFALYINDQNQIKNQIESQIILQYQRAKTSSRSDLIVFVVAERHQPLGFDI
jgi:hypothetical protein